ncbi:unnamed protein product [Brassicogethes aeneus]|uniref:Uncharacterized protein n=1 Tax=Brassicogethes aeneus TaxID=1431903 RepID=A0A9P0B3E3_BRAAE|nr:unnamed protein product [Brassicogethes aeneus]
MYLRAELVLFVNLCAAAAAAGPPTDQSTLKNVVSSLKEENSFKLLIEEVIVKSLQASNCIAVITDPMNNEIFITEWYKRFGLFISFIMINIEENEDLLTPYENTKESLMLAKTEGCQLYIILLSNGMQLSRLLRYGDRYRVLGIRSKYIMLFDNRLFEPHLHYLWKRIINVIFIKAHLGLNQDKKHLPWYEITTVPFPSPITSVFIPRRLAIWTQNRFRKAVDLFKDKTVDLRNQTLNVVAFSHLPGTAKNEKIDSQSVRATLGQNETKFSGAEVEILQTVSKAMNFQPKLYEPPNADLELWGKKQVGGKFTGIIGEMIDSFADIALGDLYYTPYLLDMMDLSVPYNTECLTFLTPEALNDNSWKTLILPFKSTMWACVIVCLILCGVVFHFLARFHQYLAEEEEEPDRPEISLFIKKKQIITLPVFYTEEKFDSNAKYMLMKEQYTAPTVEGQPMGLYQFTEPFNSILYTYSMLLLVSLPKLPTGWSLRVFTGWYWLYCLLVVVAYRASMTAILAKPQPRVTIDTIEELLDSKLSYGGWGEINKEFFKSVQESATKNLDIVDFSVTITHLLAVLWSDLSSNLKRLVQFKPKRDISVFMHLGLLKILQQLVKVLNIILPPQFATVPSN